MTIPPLTISQLEQQTGIARDTLRIWERRYGFPNPQRAVNGERQYSADHLEKLYLIRQLLDSGLRPGKLVSLPLLHLQELAQQRVNAPAWSEDVQELLGLLGTSSRHNLECRLHALLEQYGLEGFLIKVVAPLNIAVGEAWFTGRIGVFDEHQYSELIKMVVLNALHSLPERTGTTRAVLTTMPGEQHGLGLLMVACMLALEGVDVLLLGTQTPLEEIVRGAEKHQCTIVGVSCSSYLGQRRLVPQLSRLRALLAPGITLWVGGDGAAGLRALPAGIRLFSSLQQIPAALHSLAS